MKLRNAWLVALLLATAVFVALTGAVLTFNAATSPDYFDTAGKYIHRL